MYVLMLLHTKIGEQKWDFKVSYCLEIKHKMYFPQSKRNLDPNFLF